MLPVIDVVVSLVGTFAIVTLHEIRDWKEPGGVDGNSAYMVR